MYKMDTFVTTSAVLLCKYTFLVFVDVQNGLDGSSSWNAASVKLVLINIRLLSINSAFDSYSVSVVYVNINYD